MVAVPCKDPHQRGQNTTLRVPIVLPHEILNWLSANKRFAVSSDAIRRFWQRWKQFKPFHPASDTELHNPLGISGDDARYTLGGAKIIIICCNLELVDRAHRSNSNDASSYGLSTLISNFLFEENMCHFV